MAARQCLPSDPDFLLRYIDELPDDADSDFEFEGYLDEDEGPVACTSQDDELQRSPSLDRHIITPSMSSLSGRRRIYAPHRATFYSERRFFFTAYLAVSLTFQRPLLFYSLFRYSFSSSHLYFYICRCGCSQNLCLYRVPIAMHQRALGRHKKRLHTSSKAI